MDFPIGATRYLYVSGPLIGLIGHLLLHTGQLLLQVGHLVLVQLCEIVQLLLQPLVPEPAQTQVRSPETRVKSEEMHVVVLQGNGHHALSETRAGIKARTSRVLPVPLLLQAPGHVGVVALQLAFHVLDGVLHVRLAGLDLLQALQQSVPGAVHVMMVVVVVSVQPGAAHRGP